MNGSQGKDTKIPVGNVGCVCHGMSIQSLVDLKRSFFSESPLANLRYYTWGVASYILKNNRKKYKNLFTLKYLE